jgi:hypothetical protein
MENMPFHMSSNSVAAVHPAKSKLDSDRTCTRSSFPSLTDLLARRGQWLHGWMALLLMIATAEALAANPPELHAEAQRSDARPYAQQTVMLRLHVVHSPAVTELDVDPVRAPDFTLKLVAGPPRTTRLSGSQQMTSDFVYALTPLSSGPLHLPPLVVRARVVNATVPNGQFDSEEISSSSEPLSLEVPALPEHAASLLPLYALDVRLRHDVRAPLTAGRLTPLLIPNVDVSTQPR